jgi:Galactose oxidase, central domain
MYGGTGYYGFLSDLWRFNLFTRTWKLIETLPIEDLGLNGGKINFIYESTEYLALFGGQSWSGYTNDLYL